MNCWGKLNASMHRMIALTACLFLVSGVNVSADETVPTDAPTLAGTDTLTFEPDTESERYNHDCVGCTRGGFFWCPLDARCHPDDKSPFEPTYFPFKILKFSCQGPEDLFTDQALCSPPENFFSDPMYTSNEWVYNMINIRPVWEKGYFGASIRIRINDNGFDLNHTEFADRVDLASSCDDLWPTAENEANGFSHGTAVTSIIAATGNNNECAVGIAPEASLSFCKFTETDDVLMTYQLDTFDIHHNSWGPQACEDVNNDELQRRRRMEDSPECPFLYDNPLVDNPCEVCEFPLDADVSSECERTINYHCNNFFRFDEKACFEHLEYHLGGNCAFSEMNETVLDAFTTGILEGRDGKGIIYVFASGNEYEFGEDATQNGYYQNNRFTISVGAVGQDGLFAAYSNPGTSILLSAPGGNIYLNDNQQSVADINTVDGCSDSGEGTSFSSPVVSGVIALMLEANPDLTWRDVQAILAETSKPVEDENDDTNATNSAGFWHSNKYGFGIVDAARAVETAEVWQNVGPEQMDVLSATDLNLFIPDDASSPVSTSLTFENSGLTAETVYVYVNLDHSSRGHLEITLTSPGGMSSRLYPGLRPENGQAEWWKFTTVRHWGEDVDGEWTLTLVDRKAGDVESCVDVESVFETLDENFPEVGCQLIEAVSYCVDSQPNLELLEECGDLYLLDVLGKPDNLTMTEACCACGGGGGAAALTSSLVKWELVIYGTDADANYTESPDAETPGTDPPQPCKTIVEVACDIDTLSILCEAVALASLDRTLSEGIWTVFAPTNDAILDALAKGLGAASDGVASLQDTLLFHVIDGLFYADDLVCSGFLEMVNGKLSQTICDDGVPTYQKGSGNVEEDDNVPAFVSADIEACNGIIHVVDHVLLA